MLGRLSVRLKLILLAGVPVAGALFLAAFIARGAAREAESAAALGSIENLALLSVRVAKLLDELQLERNELALRLGRATTLACHGGQRTDPCGAQRLPRDGSCAHQRGRGAQQLERRYGGHAGAVSTGFSAGEPGIVRLRRVASQVRGLAARLHGTLQIPCGTGRPCS